MRRTSRTLVALSTLTAALSLAMAGYGLFACTSDEGTILTTDAGNEAGADAASTVDAGADVLDIFVRGDAGCPVAIPSVNQPCNEPGLWCEYADGGPHSLCTTKTHCDVLAKSGNVLGWHVTLPEPGCGVQPIDCPAAYGEPVDAACLSQGMCDYPEGRCGCITCDNYDGSPEQDQWMCRAWSSIPAAFVDGGAITTSPTCTAERARLGTPCSDHTVVCGYDSCNGIPLGPYMTCSDFPASSPSTWVVGPQTDSCNRPGCR